MNIKRAHDQCRGVVEGTVDELLKFIAQRFAFGEDGINHLRKEFYKSHDVDGNRS